MRLTAKNKQDITGYAVIINCEGSAMLQKDAMVWK
jgi:hypothetical protein